MKLTRILKTGAGEQVTSIEGDEEEVAFMLDLLGMIVNPGYGAESPPTDDPKETIH